MKAFLLFACTIICFANYAQKWTPVVSTSNYVIYQAEIHYTDKANDIDHQRIIFKYENKTNDAIKLHFKRALNYDGNWAIQDRGFEITIPAHSSVTYDESKKYDKSFFIFKKDHQGWIKETLLDYHINDVTLIKL